MTRRLAFLVPGDLHTRTGGYGYDRRLADGLPAHGWPVDVVPLPDGFPFPTAGARAEADRVLAAQPDGTVVLADGLALGVLPTEAARHAARLRLVALVHHPLALETGLARAQADALRASERDALAAARHVVVTSRATAARLPGWGVEAGRVTVIEPGTDPAPAAAGSGGPGVHLLIVAALTPRKGYDVLAAALGALADRTWRLTVVGSLTTHPETAAAFTGALARHGLGDRVRLAGELDGDGVSDAYATADVFVLPSHHEGYGMAAAEALARGLPAVVTSTGAMPELVGNDAGLVVPPGDPAALTAALGRVLDDDALRARLRTGARARRARLPTWDAACERMARTLDGVADG